MSNYTKAERAAINRAYEAITYAAGMSWSDSGRVREACQLERKQAAPVNPSPTLWARARVVKLWAQGYAAPDTLCSKVAGWRPGALLAFMLGADMATRHATDDGARGDATRKAAEFCPAAIDAYEAQSARALADLS